MAEAQAEVLQERSGGAGKRQRDLGVALLTMGAVALSWLLWKAAGVDLDVTSGAGSRHVGLVSAMVTAAVAALVGGGVLRFLERRTSRALTVWTWLGVAALLISLLGPLGATTGIGMVALASLHLVVGVVVLVGERRVRHRGVA
jgi:hypothetical protein